MNIMNKVEEIKLMRNLLLNDKQIIRKKNKNMLDKLNQEFKKQ